MQDYYGRRWDYWRSSSCCWRRRRRLKKGKILVVPPGIGSLNKRELFRHPPSSSCKKDGGKRGWRGGSSSSPALDYAAARGPSPPPADDPSSSPIPGSASAPAPTRQPFRRILPVHRPGAGQIHGRHPGRERLAHDSPQCLTSFERFIVGITRFTTGGSIRIPWNPLGPCWIYWNPVGSSGIRTWNL